MPYKSSVPLLWRAQKNNYDKCRLNKYGIIETFTIIRSGPSGFDKYTPYIVGIIKFNDGSKITGQIIGNFDGVKIGKKVHPVLRKRFEDGKDGIIFYGFKFELIE